MISPPTLADAPPQLRKAIDTLLSKSASHVQGILLVGSRSRGYHDPTSDFDLEIIVDDDFYAQLDQKQRLALVWEGKPFNSRLIGDTYTESRHHLEAKQASVLDVDHWPYEAAAIWYDRDGDMGSLVQQLAVFPDAIWESRLKTHHVDFWYHVGRARKIAERPSRLNYALVLTRAIHAYIKCVFVLNKRWPPLVHWAEQALEQSDLPYRPQNDVALLTTAITTLDVAPLQELVEQLSTLFDEVGMTWHHDRLAEFLEVLSESYAEARELWSRY